MTDDTFKKHPLVLDVYNQALKIVIKSQEYTYTTAPFQKDNVPIWVYNLCNSVKKDGNLRLNVIATSLYMDILHYSSSGRNNAATIIAASLLDTNDTGTSTDMITLTVIEKLWKNMDLLSQESNSTTQLYKLNVFAGPAIRENIKKSLANSEITEKDKAFRRISKFWKRTGGKSLNNKDCEDIRNYSVFVMLDFLDSESPLLRYSAKGWLEETINFRYILIPLYKDMLSSTKWTVQDSGMFYNEEYDTTKILGHFRNIKNILITITGEF
jgi:hypothetical protein